jgi:sulfite exporter TauE/SafE/copper chaperone CopZ
MLNTKTISIKGMHCKSCELLIEDELIKIDGVEKVDISHRSGEATIHFNGKHLNHTDIAHAIREAGYELGKTGRLPFLSTRKVDYIEFGVAAVIFMLLYFILKELGVFDLALVKANNFSSLPVVLLVGLTAGVSTCMALVGGLVLGVASKYAQNKPYASTQEKFIPHIFFNAGRIASFFLLGGIIGVIGSYLQLSSSVMGLLVVAVGAMMIVLGLQLTNLFPWLNSISFAMPKGIARFFGITEKANSEYSHTNSALLGALTFFVPCGFTQSIQLYAMTTGSFMSGAITMAVFAIGTAPGLLGLGGLTSFIQGKSSGLIYKIIGIVVIALALFNISNGLTLAGFKKNVPKVNVSTQQDPNVKIENGVQVVRMEQNARGYYPDHITVKKGMPVKWVVKSVYPYSCASSLVSEKLNIRTLLTEKEQVFNFTPKENGDIPFSCSMGMYWGNFSVIN